MFKIKMKLMKEKLVIWFAWTLPHSVVYWCGVRLVAHATTGKHGNQSPIDILANDVLARWYDLINPPTAAALLKRQQDEKENEQQKV